MGLVALCEEGKGILATFDDPKGVIVSHRLESHLTPFRSDGADVSQHLALRPQLLHPGLEGGIQSGQSRHEGVDITAIVVARREQSFDDHVRKLQLHAHVSGQDQELSRHVDAAQIIPGIRFGVAPGPGLPHGFRKRRAIPDQSQDEGE